MYVYRVVCRHACTSSLRAFSGSVSESCMVFSFWALTFSSFLSWAASCLCVCCSLSRETRTELRFFTALSRAWEGPECKLPLILSNTIPCSPWTLEWVPPPAMYVYMLLNAPTLNNNNNKSCDWDLQKDK